MLFQALSARLGIVTSRSLAELCREHFPAFWSRHVAGERGRGDGDRPGGVAGRSDRPAFCFTCPAWGVLADRPVTYGLLLFQRHGFRPIELIIGAFVALIALAT